MWPGNVQGNCTTYLLPLGPAETTIDAFLHSGTLRSLDHFVDFHVVIEAGTTLWGCLHVIAVMLLQVDRGLLVEGLALRCLLDPRLL